MRNLFCAASANSPKRSAARRHCFNQEHRRVRDRPRARHPKSRPSRVDACFGRIVLKNPKIRSGTKSGFYAGFASFDVLRPREQATKLTGWRLPLKAEIFQSALRGEVIPAALLMAGLQDLLTAAQSQTWRLEENRGELMGWIDLFPFSDDPEKVLEAVALLPEQRRSPHALRRLLQTLPQGPSSAALAVLKRLAADDAAFFRDFEWMNSLINVGTEAAALVMLEELCDGLIPVGDSIRLSHALTGLAQKYPAVRAAMLARYRALPAGNIRNVLEMAMDDLTDEEVFTALFDAHVDTPQSFIGLARPIQILQSVGSRRVSGKVRLRSSPCR